MKISKEQLEKIAYLSRLKINPDDLLKFESNFNNIIEYVGILQEVEISQDSSKEEVLSFDGILANDENFEFPLGDWKNNVHHIHDNQIAVKAIFQDDQR